VAVAVCVAVFEDVPEVDAVFDAVDVQDGVAVHVAVADGVHELVPVIVVEGVRLALGNAKVVLN
jgi:hypothetical protein